MALVDLSARDYTRLLSAFREASAHRDKLLPNLDELIPAIRNAIGTEGDLVENLVPVFGEPIRRGFDLVKTILSNKYGQEYTDELWVRVNRKGD